MDTDEPTDPEQRFAEMRRNMVDRQLRARGIDDPAVLTAFGDLPRHLFVPEDQRPNAYADRPLPIGRGQTISQPYIVALMVQELGVSSDDRVLDVGSGSGYQTAVLATLARHVCAVERMPDLAERAIGLLGQLGVANVTFRTGDGSLGCPEEAPFERIICGAGAPEIPDAWVDQLTDGGRIVAPVGDTGVQTLVAVDKTGNKTRRRTICDVRFVKLIGRQGWG
ncbi:MAG: protein-L-isoaspartate(D-aspartate) O-methyltransferase [Phycisphaerae bacterium]|nr:protein-L-isoaspartate(D-aspartate) O-methyltransferase [Phycisphaerae bacterium]